MDVVGCGSGRLVGCSWWCPFQIKCARNGRSSTSTRAGSFLRLNRVSVAKHSTLDFGFKQTLMVEWSLCCMVEANEVDKENGNAEPVRVWHGFCIHALES